MNTHLDSTRYRRHMARTATMLFLLGMMSLVPQGVAAQSSGPAPTVGAIVVESYDCDTGRLDYHVPLTDLPHVPNPGLLEEPLAHYFDASYEQGPNVAPLPNTINSNGAGSAIHR